MHLLFALKNIKFLFTFSHKLFIIVNERAMVLHKLSSRLVILSRDRFFLTTWRESR